MNVILLLALPPITDGENLELHLVHLARMMHHEACIPAHSLAPQCIRLVRRIAIWRDFVQWLETNCDATQLILRAKEGEQSILGRLGL